MSTKTISALMARGMDSSLAKILGTQYTLGKLKQLNRDKLIALGVSDTQVRQLHSEQRPPIPQENLFRVLHKNRRTCCVCRDPDRPVIVHHITDWATSRSHDESNLSVLCLEHHDSAHTKKLLSQSLTEAEIRAAKKAWEKDVLHLDALAIVRLKNENDYARWDWMNLPRIFELVLKRKIHLKNTTLFRDLLAKGFIDTNGVLRPETDWSTEKKPRYYFLDFMDGFYVGHYLGELVDQVLESLPITDITSHIPNKSQLKSLIREGEYIAAQLPFYFRAVENIGDKKHEIKRAYYKGHGVRIEYVFDAWHCMSSSARYDGMSGRKVQTVFGPVRSVLDEDGDLVISISCLASGTAFATHVARSG